MLKNEEDNKKTDAKSRYTTCKLLHSLNVLDQNSRVPDQNGVSLLYIMLEIYHSGRGSPKFYY